MHFAHLSMLLAAMSATVSGTALKERNLEECSSAAMDAYRVITNYPIPDPSLSSFVAEQTGFATNTEDCVIPHITGSMSDEYSSYASSWSSWQKSYKDEVSDIFEACSGVSGFESQLSSLSESATFCSTIVWLDASGVAAPADKTGAAEADSTQTNSDNAAPRETGKVVAAAAVAGMIVAGLY